MNNKDRFTRFNSMKVRLKHAEHYQGLCGWWFQFHEGPIKTDLFCSSRDTFNGVSIP